MKRIGSVDPIDVLAVIALALVAIGVAMIYVPAAFIVVGALLLLYAALATRTTEGAKP